MENIFILIAMCICICFCSYLYVIILEVYVTYHHTSLHTYEYILIIRALYFLGNKTERLKGWGFKKKMRG